MNEYLDVVLESWNMLSGFTECVTDTRIAAFHPERGFGENARGLSERHQYHSVPTQISKVREYQLGGRS